MRYYVYFLIDPRINTVFYIGKGSNGSQRHLCHLEEFLKWDKLGRFKKPRKGFNLHKLRKIASIIDAGFDIQYEIAFESNDEQEILLQEVNCIAAFGRENLTNLTDGGEGTSGFTKTRDQIEKTASKNRGRKHSNEHKKKISDKLTGREFSDETRKKISNALKDREFSEEHKKKIGELKKGNEYFAGKIHSEEAKEKIRRKLFGRKHTEETKKKISTARKGRKFTEEHRRNLSNSVRKSKARLKSHETFNDEQRDDEGCHR